MQAVDLVIEHKPELSMRARQCASMFDVEPDKKMRLHWKGELDLDFDWSVGLIVGPSGCGKSTLARHIFGDEAMAKSEWGAPCVLDDFDDSLSIEEITRALSSVGFNTVPAWLRPFHVLSNGEQFRASMARLLVEGTDLIVVDEFTSVVDRQVAKCASHAIQKYARRTTRKLVAVTCHFDVLDWLQPDWVLEPAGMDFQRRSVQPRPRLEVELRKVPKSLWRVFASYHYLTAVLPSSCHCWAAFIDGRPVAFTAAAKMPHPKARDIYRLARTVVLPDWQGIGLSFALKNKVGAAFKSAGYRLRSYPATPGYIRANVAQPNWACVKRPGSAVSSGRGQRVSQARSCAVFEYRGESMDRDRARFFLGL